MNTRRRSHLVALAVLAASLIALAFTGSALAATQNIGPYQVTDAVTNDGTNTTATYTITVPGDTSTSLPSTNVAPAVQAISHVDVGVCNDLADRTYAGTLDTDGTDDAQDPDPTPPSAFGSFEKNGDPSLNNLTTPIFKWDTGQDLGKTYVYTYTVPGVWDPTPTTLYIKSGSYGNTRDPHDPFTGTVDGIACRNTPPTQPGGSGGTTSTLPGTVAGQQTGTQQVLGERVESGEAHLAGASGCQRKAFRVKVSGKQIRKVVFTVDGKRVKKVTASASGNTYSITVNPNKFKPGSHLVAAKVTFTAASNTRSKTLRVRFARCVRHTAPAFTG